MASMSITEFVAREELTTDQEIGARVHQLMFLRKMSQTRLAEAMGMAQSGVSKKIRGAVGWSTDDLRVVSRELRTTVAYLFGETDDPSGWAPSGSNRRPTDYGVAVSEVVDLGARRAAKAFHDGMPTVASAAFTG